MLSKTNGMHASKRVANSSGSGGGEAIWDIIPRLPADP